MTTTAPTSEREAAIDALCSRHTLGAVRAMAQSTTAAGTFVALVLSVEVSWSRLVFWLAGLVVIAVARLWLYRVAHATQRSDAEVRVLLRWFSAIGVWAALWWGVGLLVVSNFSTSILVTTTVLLGLVGNMTGGASTIQGAPRTALLVFGSSLAMPVFELVRSGEAARQMVALMVVGLFFASISALRQNHASLREAFRLRLENQDLLASLALEQQREAAARRDAERANRDKSRFLAAASHDARQPLHALGLFVDTLKTRPLEPKAQQLVGSIDQAHGALVSLHEALLEVSSSDVGAVVPRRRPVVLRELLAVLETESAPRAAQRGLKLDVVASDVVVLTDPDLLLRVLRNLVSNALTYTPRGRVLISARRRAGQALLQVWDTGVGIAASEHERIFDELYQVGNANRGGGLGLGLSIVRRLSRALGTDVTVRSIPGKGSVFSLSQPLASLAPAQPIASRGEVVLLVDDDGLTRQALGAMLEGWGYEVLAAQTAEEALEYQAQLERLDVVLTDLWLPGRSGVELLQELRQKRAGVRAIVVSGDTSKDAPTRVQELGAAFLRKPVRSAALQELLVGKTAT
ncbi:MAG: ATP-binding protein [Myxococcaceae bacterium]